MILPQPGLEHLSQRAFWQFRDYPDAAGDLVSADVLATMGYQFLDRDALAGTAHDDGEQ
jgi:hypothetical protein